MKKVEKESQKGYYRNIMEPETEMNTFNQDVERISHGAIHVVTQENLRSLANRTYGATCKYLTFRGVIFFVPENSDLLHIDIWNGIQQVFPHEVLTDLPIDAGSMLTKTGTINFTKGPRAGDSLLQLLPKEHSNIPIFHGQYFNDKDATLAIAENIQLQAHADDLLILATP